MDLNTTIYSFTDLAGSIAHPNFGIFEFGGEGLGIGSIAIAKQADDSNVDISADGAPMISKIAGRVHNITLVCQQTSTVDKFLLKLYDYLKEIAPADQWASSVALLRGLADGVTHEIIGLTFQKKADRSYQAQGQNITWNLIASHVISEPLSS